MGCINFPANFPCRSLCTRETGTIMKKKTFLALVLTLLVSSCLESETAVKFSGGTITTEQIDKEAKMELFRAEQEMYKIREQKAHELAEKAILEKEASSQKISVEELLSREVTSKIRPVSDEELKNIYEMYKAQIQQPYEQIKEAIRKDIMMNQEQQLRQGFVHGLFEKYNFELVLKEPVAPRVKIDEENDPSIGPKNAKVVIVEFSDYECPYCRRMQDDVKKIRNEYSDKVRWVFKDFPLDFHQQAMPAHIASNCAEDQDKYFEFHDRVFAAPPGANGKPDMSTEFLLKTARELGLNVDKFSTCIADKDGKYRKEVEADIAYGSSLGVRGTPSIFINGRFINGMVPYETLKQEIEKELK